MNRPPSMKKFQQAPNQYQNYSVYNSNKYPMPKSPTTIRNSSKQRINIQIDKYMPRISQVPQPSLTQSNLNTIKQNYATVIRQQQINQQINRSRNHSQSHSHSQSQNKYNNSNNNNIKTISNSYSNKNLQKYKQQQYDFHGRQLDEQVKLMKQNTIYKSKPITKQDINTQQVYFNMFANRNKNKQYGVPSTITNIKHINYNNTNNNNNSKNYDNTIDNNNISNNLNNNNNVNSNKINNVNNEINNVVYIKSKDHNNNNIHNNNENMQINIYTINNQQNTSNNMKQNRKQIKISAQDIQKQYNRLRIYMQQLQKQNKILKQQNYDILKTNNKLKQKLININNNTNIQLSNKQYSRQYNNNNNKTNSPLFINQTNKLEHSISHINDNKNKNISKKQSITSQQDSTYNLLIRAQQQILFRDNIIKQLQQKIKSIQNMQNIQNKLKYKQRQRPVQQLDNDSTYQLIIQLKNQISRANSESQLLNTKIQYLHNQITALVTTINSISIMCEAQKTQLLQKQLQIDLQIRHTKSVLTEWKKGKQNKQQTKQNSIQQYDISQYYVNSDTKGSQHVWYKKDDESYCHINNIQEEGNNKFGNSYKNYDQFNMMNRIQPFNQQNSVYTFQNLQSNVLPSKDYGNHYTFRSTVPYKFN